MVNDMARLWNKIKEFHYGEATLWLLFLIAFVLGFEKETAATLAGICALAAIGVRVTRLPKSKQVADAD
jgi:hypothetical protein